ncbi:hypothetical protein J2795_004536 [Chryseobacterium bernardetii]|jgi:hypothetical protein|uniref:DUF4280 domain-containing protein n=3 Tax=Chryseobacterium TaxID=59732 RepID=A0A543EAH4_9FLAO|nr:MULTISPECIES: hypothetical protein [Chryseobacterium]MDR6372002.1 hypothetical protein [Chryseobacterium vietnamense]MDR6443784.1 hypothetical protein [Chryseobacterium bernardetii]MDR6461457.1 hypothetical protein [Chryseobacterium vietnamense]TQM18489.1 hypothetical protein FB551_4273 [Chryseobacterium aquifrigidense]
MSASYIPKDVYTVCTFQTDSEPRQLIPTREPITVFYGSDRTRPLLTIEDRNINKEFPCKSPKNAMWGFLCFGAGLIVGALLVLSGPVGWAALAVGVAVLACGAAAAYHATKINHLCTGSLGKGNWKIEHEKVKFDQFKAITQNSILVCDTGGLLSPIFSYSVAKKYALQIESNNGKEIVLNAAASFFGGAGIVIAGAEMGIAKTLLWMGGTMAAMNEGSYWEREIIRNNSLEDNSHYQDMNKEADENSRIPGYLKDLPESVTGITPSDLASPDILELNEKGGLASRDGKTPIFFNGKWYVQDWQKNLIEIKQGTALSQDLTALEGVDSREVWKTPEGKAIVENIRNGKYSESLVATAKDGLGRVRPRNLPNLAKELPSIKMQNIKNIGKLGVKGGGFIGFFFPFIATYFSEDSRRILANAMAEDAGNGIHIIAMDA